MSDFSTTRFVVGPMATNAYLLRCTTSGEQLLVDAGADAPRLLEAVGDRPLAAVVTTHADIDHWEALEEVVKATGARSLVHAADAGDVDVVTEAVEDGTCVPFGRCTVEVVHIGGHTPGSIVLAAGGSLLTGDCLFPGGVGGTFGNQGDFETLLGQVERRLFDRYADGVVVLPGHGEATTIGAERPFLDEWRARGW